MAVIVLVMMWVKYVLNRVAVNTNGNEWGLLFQFAFFCGRPIYYSSLPSSVDAPFIIPVCLLLWMPYLLFQFAFFYGCPIYYSNLPSSVDAPFIIPVFLLLWMPHLLFQGINRRTILKSVLDK
jgi:hypothetical protein